MDVAPYLSKDNKKPFKEALRARNTTIEKARVQKIHSEKKQLEEAQNNAEIRERERESMGLGSQSQARLFARLASMEGVTNDETNFPSLEGEAKNNDNNNNEGGADHPEGVGIGIGIGEKHEESSKSRWDNSWEFRERLEQLSDYLPAPTKDQQFPELGSGGGGGGGATVISSAPPPGVWGQKKNVVPNNNNNNNKNNNSNNNNYNNNNNHGATSGPQAVRNPTQKQRGKGRNKHVLFSI